LFVLKGTPTPPLLLLLIALVHRHRRKVYALHNQFQTLTKVQFVDDDALARDLATIPPAPSDLKKKSSKGTKEKPNKNKKKKGGESAESMTTPVPAPPVAAAVAVVADENGTKKKKKKDKDVTVAAAAVAVKEVEPVTPAAPDAAAVSAPPPPNYIASQKFSGAKAGYVFKKVCRHLLLCLTSVVYLLWPLSRAPRVSAITKINLLEAQPPPKPPSLPPLLLLKRNARSMRSSSPLAPWSHFSSYRLRNPLLPVTRMAWNQRKRKKKNLEFALGKINQKVRRRVRRSPSPQNQQSVSQSDESRAAAEEMES
jgi:hypothetical protein